MSDSNLVTIDPRDIRTVQWKEGTEAAIRFFMKTAGLPEKPMFKKSHVRFIDPKKHGNDVVLAFLDFNGCYADYSNKEQTTSGTLRGRALDNETAQAKLLDNMLNPKKETFVRIQSDSMLAFRPAVLVQISPADDRHPR